MSNSTIISYPIKPIASIDDDAIITQLPTNVVHQLGSLEETGFHLTLHRRDLFFTHGLVQYLLGDNKAHVELD